jgi:hypothetical protein
VALEFRPSLLAAVEEVIPKPSIIFSKSISTIGLQESCKTIVFPRVFLYSLFFILQNTLAATSFEPLNTEG